MDSKVLLLIWRRWWKNHLALRDEGWTVEWNTNDPYGFVLVIKDVCDAVWIDNKRSTRRIFYSNPFLSNGLHLCCIWHQDFLKIMRCCCCFWTLKRQLEKKRQFFSTCYNTHHDFMKSVLWFFDNLTLPPFHNNNSIFSCLLDIFIWKKIGATCFSTLFWKFSLFIKQIINMAEHEVLRTWHVPRTWHNIDMLGMEVLRCNVEVIVSVLSGRSSICSFFVLCLSFKNSCLSMCIELHLWTDLQFFKWVLFKLVFFSCNNWAKTP